MSSWIASYLKDALTQVKLHDLTGKFLREVEFPTLGTASGFGGKRKDTETFYAVGKGLFEKAGKLYDAFNVNVSILGGTGSMAGTDDAGRAWATSYEDSAPTGPCGATRRGDRWIRPTYRHN